VTSRFVWEAADVSEHDLTRGVAVRLSGHALDDSGKLRDYDIWDVAVRGALLVDLAFAGRVAHEEDSVVVDATPTGFEPADRLLAPIVVEPERPLDWWMDHGGVDLGDLVRDNVESGRWAARVTLVGRRYSVLETPAEGDDALAAAVEVIGDTAGITDRRPGEPAEGPLERTGPVRWLCEAVVEHLVATHQRNLGSARAADGGGSPHF
jgi:Golgi phosphoprotein 3 (GPP34)